VKLACTPETAAVKSALAVAEPIEDVID